MRGLLSIGCPIQWATARDGFYNSTLFQKALQQKCNKSVVVFLEHNVAVDGYDRSGWSALHSATNVRNIDAVKDFLSKISGPTYKDKDGWTALDIAVWNDNDELRQLLDGGTPYIPPWRQQTGLYYPGCSYDTIEGVEEPLEVPVRPWRK